MIHSMPSMKDVFENVAQSVIDFIKEIHFFITNYNLVIAFYKYLLKSLAFNIKRC